MNKTPLLAAVVLLALFPGAALAQPIGPDVIVGDLTGPSTWGGNGLTYALSIGTTSCNVGTQPLTWQAGTPVHPVIGQNMYRLKNGRFEMVGMSWLKHGFTALQQTLCGSCNAYPNGNALGIGCSDPYSSGLNGQQSGLGPRHEVNASTGVFPMPHSQGMPAASNTIDRRLQVSYADLDPSLNAGAQYFAEGQYIHVEDAAFGNDDNNSSYRRVSVSGSSGNYNFNWSGPTVQQQAAIYAWQAVDPQVNIVTLDVANDGRFIIAYKGTPIAGTSNTHWEFAIHNLNSDRSAGSVSINTGCTATVSNLGFKDIAHHSGDPSNSIDWTGSSTATGPAWMSTQTFQQNPNGNALRWGTLYNYWFDSDTAPTSVTIGLFKPGSSPATATANLAGIPALPQYQLNSFNASLDIGGLLSNGSAPATTNAAIGATHNINFLSFLGGQQWDFASGNYPLVPRSSCPLSTASGQIINLDLTDPAFSTWFGGTFSNGPGFSNFNVNFSFPFAISLSGQMAIIAPNVSDGISLSQAVRIVFQ